MYFEILLRKVWKWAWSFKCLRHLVCIIFPFLPNLIRYCLLFSIQWNNARFRNVSTHTSVPIKKHIFNIDNFFIHENSNTFSMQAKNFLCHSLLNWNFILYLEDIFIKESAISYWTNSIYENSKLCFYIPVDFQLKLHAHEKVFLKKKFNKTLLWLESVKFKLKVFAHNFSRKLMSTKNHDVPNLANNLNQFKIMSSLVVLLTQPEKSIFKYDQRHEHFWMNGKLI